MTDAPSLGTTPLDVGAAVARGVAGGIPLVGGLVAEVVNSVIPHQKLDRLIDFVEILANEAAKLRDKQALLESRLRSSPGSDLLEEALVQASRAVSNERRQRIARILVNAVTESELAYDRTRKLLAILESLTDSELVILVYYTHLPTIGSPWHAEMRVRHPSLLRPVSREIGAPQNEVERGAINDAYERTLIGHGLLSHGPGGLTLTSLGKLLLTSAEELREAPTQPAA